MHYGAIALGAKPFIRTPGAAPIRFTDYHHKPIIDR
jgi:hypothetical protein